MNNTNKVSDQNRTQYLVCEQESTYALLMAAAGMMGAYTFNLRGGVFCNAQTANFVMMAVDFGRGHWVSGCYYFIPIFAYFSGAFLSEILPVPVKRPGFLRWDTYLVGFEMIVLFLAGLIPLSWPDHIVQVMINFIASMQYNTFRQANGIPMATTFCTNHLRQMGIAFAKMVHKRDWTLLRRERVHAIMLICFFSGGVVLTCFCKLLNEKSIWLAIILLGIVFGKMAHADLTTEHALLKYKPSGH